MFALQSPSFKDCPHSTTRDPELSHWCYEIAVEPAANNMARQIQFVFPEHFRNYIGLPVIPLCSAFWSDKEGTACLADTIPTDPIKRDEVNSMEDRAAAMCACIWDISGPIFN
jgi:hypothetical protein